MHNADTQCSHWGRCTPTATHLFHTTPARQRARYVRIAQTYLHAIQAVSLWRLAAEKHAHPASTYQLATATLRGLHVKRDVVEGRRLMKEAVRLGVPQVCLDLACSE
jgi:TPR repeat protein